METFMILVYKQNLQSFHVRMSIFYGQIKFPMDRLRTVGLSNMKTLLNAPNYVCSTSG